MVTTSLLDRDPTPEDIEAERDAPRPGVWAGEPGADLRALTQDETDALIRFELYWSQQAVCSMDDRRVLAGALNIGNLDLKLLPFDLCRMGAQCQRGGIDSDPLVRVLARRAWGERDRQWLELRGVRKGDQVTLMHELTPRGPRRRLPITAPARGCPATIRRHRSHPGPVSAADGPVAQDADAILVDVLYRSLDYHYAVALTDPD